MKQKESNGELNGADHQRMLKKAVVSLIQELQTAASKEGGMEAQAVRYLMALREHLDSGKLTAEHRSMEELKNFWSGQVPWCSTLSRSLEKIIMLHEEMTGTG